MKKRTVALLVAATVAAFALAGCGSTSSATTAADTTAEATEAAEATDAVVATEAADDGAAGFQETPIFEDVELADLINLSAVYFQPVPMAPDYETIEGYAFHLEADISALENELGYGVGDWIPYLTVDYAITDENGEDVASGTFMPMSASDGPHYGANVKEIPDGTYSVTFTIHSPAENGYQIHSDSATGPGKVLDDYFNGENLTYTYEGWDYLAQEW